MCCCTEAAQVMEREVMTIIDRIEQLFFEARRSAFGISFLCFIGTAISLAGIAMLDSELGIIIPILALIVLALFTLMFLLLAFRLFQPINEIVKMVNGLYEAVMVDELGEEPTGAGADTEKKVLAEMTQQIGKLKKEISVLKKTKQKAPAETEDKVKDAGEAVPVEEQDNFWRNLTVKYAIAGAFVSVVVFVAPDPLDLIFAVAGAVGLTAIALVYAHYEGRLKLRRGDGD